ncbi:hypothetical protein TNCV_981031 [Trichonephila clavipes]|uniref:Uncharacterized protein n=1 Tax=Trichonephila clavipes TaxID=2585209 RepID=A0A8X6VCQ5_TRICX|nr:hypothetical protein TNCV_981031 [Trichonephila clavipes]
MDFTEISSRGKRGELLERIDRQNSRFRTAKTAIIKFGLHASFVELESAKSALNEHRTRERSPIPLVKKRKPSGRKLFSIRSLDRIITEYRNSARKGPKKARKGG